MRFTKVMPNAFEKLALNAGVIATEFNPLSGELDSSDIVCATTGGTTFTATPTYNDFGSDVDNCPKNLKGFKKLESWEAKLAATGITYSAAQVKRLLGAATSTAAPASSATYAGYKVTPDDVLDSGDFETLWYICDYTNENDEFVTGETTSEAGFIAIKLNNALNTKGFELKSTDKGKGQSSFEFLAHYDQDATTGALTTPFEIYIFDPSEDTTEEEEEEDEE